MWTIGKQAEVSQYLFEDNVIEIQKLVPSCENAPPGIPIRSSYHDYKANLYNYNTILHKACGYRSIECLRYLLTVRYVTLMIHTKNAHGETPMEVLLGRIQVGSSETYRAARDREKHVLEMIGLLVEAGADTPVVSGSHTKSA
jgi:ankyrin repeat protein